MGNYPIIGPDSSVWEGPINTDQTVRGGASFILPKASELKEDKQFRNTWTNAKGKLKRGAFHFLSINGSIRNQALLFASLLYPDCGEIEPYVDYEQERVFWVAKNPVTGVRGWNHLQFSHLNGFLIYFEDEIMRLFGRWPWKYDTGIYTGYSYWKDFGSTNDTMRARPLWISCPDPVETPFPLAPWGIDWQFWQTQFSADGPTFGTDKYQAKSIDLNCYNGDWSRFNSDYVITIPVPSPMPPLPEYPVGFPKTGTVVAQPSLRVRSGPGQNYPIVGSYLNGATVTVTESQMVGADEWGHLSKEPNEIDGWVALVFGGMKMVMFQ